MGEYFHDFGASKKPLKRTHTKKLTIKLVHQTILKLRALVQQKRSLRKSKGNSTVVKISAIMYL